MEGGIREAFSTGSDETTMAMASNCLSKTSHTSHPGNRLPCPMCPMEPPPLWAGVPADTASDMRVPAQGTLWHLLRGKETHFKGQKAGHFPFFCPVTYFYPIQKGWSEEDSCCSKSLTQDYNLDTQLNVLSIFFRNIVSGKPFTSMTSLNPLWKLSPLCLGRKVEVCFEFHISCNSNHKIRFSFTSHTWPLKCNHITYTYIGSL